MPTINIPFISDTLGHSVIYEEYKGNFSDARRLAEQSLKKTRQAGDKTGEADALLACGLASLLQGEPQSAMRELAEIHRLVPDDTHRRYRAVIYTNLATYRQFNAFPNESGAGASEISARWNGPAAGAMLDQQRLALQAGLSDLASLGEGKLVVDILSMGLVSRNLLEGLDNQTPENAQRVIGIAFQSAYLFQQALLAEGQSPELLAYMTWMLADLYRRSRQIILAKQYLDQANQVYAQIGDQAGMAICQMSWGDWLSAPFSTPAVWNFAIQSSGMQSNQLSWPVEEQEFNQTGLDKANAQAAYNQAERLFQAANSGRGLAAIDLRRAYLAMLDGDFQAAVAHAGRAENAFKACGDNQGYRTSQVQLILSQVGAGELTEERETAAEIGIWGASRGSFSYTLGLGLMLGRAGRHWLIRMGDYERSLACFRLAGELYTGLGAEVNRVQSLVDQGDVYQAIGDRTSALVLYEQALDAQQAMITARPQIAGDVRDQALILAVSVFDLYNQYMQADGMERSANRLQSLMNQVPVPKVSAAELADLVKGGMSEYLSTLSDGAVSALDKGITEVQSRALADMGKFTLDQARVLVPLYRAVQARNMGEKAIAKKCFPQAEQAALQGSSYDRFYYQASVLAFQKEYPQAVEVFKQFLAEDMKNYGFAGDLIRWMEAVAGGRGQAEVLRNAENSLELAVIFLTRCKAFEEAHQYLDALVQSAGPTWWKRNARPWQSLSDYGEIYEGLGQLEKAMDYYDQAIAELEKRRNQLSRDELKTALSADKGAQFLYFMAARAVYKIVVQAGEDGDTERQRAFMARLFNYAELGKARALLDLMAGSAAQTSAAMIGTGALDTHMRAWRRFNAQLTLHRGLLAQERNSQGSESDKSRILRLTQQIEEDETALRAVEDDLAKTNPEYYRLINPQTPVMTLADVSSALPPGTALLQYYFLSEELLSWAVTSQGMVEIHREPLDVKALERQIRSFHRACEEQGPVSKAASDLAGIFLVPFADTINACEHLLIVPFGAAHAMPFHVLPWNGKPLTQTHSIRYLPSASSIRLLADLPATRLNSLLAVGNPSNMVLHAADGSSAPVPSLRWAATEASYVAGLFAEGEALIGKKATEEAFHKRLKEKDVLHLATHGYLSEESPLASSILFAEGHELSVYELMGIKLDGQLVVLSACQTAAGEVTGGDDVLGLTRGLLGAGARHAVVSLWAVNDVSTSLLMGDFYRQLRVGGTPEVALQAAQNYLRRLKPEEILSEVDRLRRDYQSVMPDPADLKAFEENRGGKGGPTSRAKDYSHPYFWAPFILVG